MKSYQQVADHACGTAVVRDLLDHFGMYVPTERTLLRNLQATFKDGIEPQRIVDYFTAIGLKAKLKTGGTLRDLKRWIDRGVFPIIVWQDWGGHYVIVVDYYDGPSAWSGGRWQLADPAASYEARTDGFTETSGDRLKALWMDRYKGKAIPGLYIVVQK